MRSGSKGVHRHEGVEVVVYFWAIIASISVMLCEIQASRGIVWADLWYMMVPLGLLTQFSIYQMILAASGHLMSAFVVFSGVTFLSRLLWTLYQGKPIGMFLWAAIGLYVVILVLRELERSLM